MIQAHQLLYQRYDFYYLGYRSLCFHLGLLVCLPEGYLKTAVICVDLRAGGRRILRRPGLFRQPFAICVLTICWYDKQTFQGFKTVAMD